MITAIFRLVAESFSQIFVVSLEQVRLHDFYTTRISELSEFRDMDSHPILGSPNLRKTLLQLWDMAIDLSGLSSTSGGQASGCRFGSVARA